MHTPSEPCSALKLVSRRKPGTIAPPLVTLKNGSRLSPGRGVWGWGAGHHPNPPPCPRGSELPSEAVTPSSACVGGGGGLHARVGVGLVPIPMNYRGVA